MTTSYYICDKPCPDYRTLGSDNLFYTGYSCIGRKSDTLVYKRKSAALKRLNTRHPLKRISDYLHPAACLLVVEDSINYFIDRNGKPVSIRP